MTLQPTFPQWEGLSLKPNGTRPTGILPSQMIRNYVEAGYIQAQEPIEEAQIQPASIDLRLGSVAYQVRASFLPGEHSRVLSKMTASELKVEEIDLTKSGALKKDCVYIIPLMEKIKLPKDVSARANPRSTAGRLDMFVRLVTDFGTEFDNVAPGYRGALYAEIVPRSFSIRLRKGTELLQLRFVRGNPLLSDIKLRREGREAPLIFSADENVEEAFIKQGVRLSVNLQTEHPSNIVGYKAKKNAPALDFEKTNWYEPLNFWEPIYSSDEKSIVLTPGDFFILSSKERVRVPTHCAAEMVPFEPTIGEFRVHYAGFFDPGFGDGQDTRGTPAVLEVRADEAPFLIEDGQMIARLLYHPLVEVPDKIYGPKIGSSYQFQQVTLSKQFKQMQRQPEY